MSYILKALIQNQYWKPNAMGYTPDIHEAGTFSYEEAHEMCRNSNTNGKINLLMVPEEKIEAINNGEMTLPTSQKIKKPIDEVLQSMGNTSSLGKNPISLLIETLNENHYYPDIKHDQLKYFGKPINYGETLKDNLKIHSEVNNQQERAPLYVNMSIYRKDNGLYEMVNYENYGEPENKAKKKSRYSMKP